MSLATLLIDIAVLLLVVVVLLLIGIQIGVERAWWRVRSEPTAVRYAVGVLIVVGLATMTAVGVLTGHGDTVRDNAIRGAWGGALVGAWVATRKQRERLGRASEAFGEGLAEAVDGAQVGAVVGGVILSPAEVWKGASLGAIIGVGGWAWGRMRMLRA
jgi:hypothetical protein